MTKPLLLATQGEAQSRLPIWFLRQAGRYLPEYRELRSKMSFVELCTSPRDAAEVTLQPLRRFDLDAAIIFSDILVTPMALGQTLSFDAGHGPVLSTPIRSMKDVLSLRSGDVTQDLAFVGEAIGLTKASLQPHQTMIGFAGAPFTVACYMIEGQGSKSYVEVKKMAWCEPEAMRALLERLTEVTIKYLHMQVQAGAEYLMLFDTWANQVDEQNYRDWVLPHVMKICDAVKAWGVPLCYYPGQGGDLLPHAAACSSQVLAIDWRIPLRKGIEAARTRREKVVVQGNLDPITFFAPENRVRQAIRGMIEEGKKADGHIVNVGHGLTPGTPIQAIEWAIDEVRKSECALT